MTTGRLSIDQAPPQSVPLSFYAILPVALAAAGTLLAVQGNLLLTTNWLPQTIAWTHLGTLGLLTAAMFGSMYQMVPVVLGTPVPGTRLAYAVAIGLALGIVGLVAGLALGIRPLILAGGVLLGLAFCGFVLPMAIALLRARGGGHTRTGMRGALVCVLALALVGLRLAWGHAMGVLPDNRGVWLAVHVALGLLGWVGTLIMAVSWQTVPMFYLTQALAPQWTRILSLLVPASALLATLFALGNLPLTAILLAAFPAALVVWVLQPGYVALLLHRRRRRRLDPTLHFWWLGLACAPLTLVAAILTWTVDWQPAPLLFGWLAIVGWAGAIVHGMLTRIVPFLVWFHRFAEVAGKWVVPSMKQLLPDREVTWNLRAHAATVLCGVAAILSGADLLARATGLLLVATGILLALALLRTVQRATPPRRNLPIRPAAVHTARRVDQLPLNSGEAP